jgi:hypothetical protein
MTIEEMGNMLRKTGKSVVESTQIQTNTDEYRHNKRYKLLR